VFETLGGLKQDSGAALDLVNAAFQQAGSSRITVAVSDLVGGTLISCQGLFTVHLVVRHRDISVVGVHRS